MSNLIELPPNHYRVDVSYAPMPYFDELERYFGQGNVSHLFDGRPWKLHPPCVEMSRRPGYRIFYIHDVDDYWMRRDQIDWGIAQRTSVAPRGYRSTTHDEVYEFCRIHPELTDLVALGSTALYDGHHRHVAYVWGGGGRILDSYWVVRKFVARYRPLFVAITEADLRGRAA